MRHLAVAALVLLPLVLALGWNAVDPLGHATLESCEALRGQDARAVDAVLDPPWAVWPDGGFTCPSGVVCPISTWDGPVREYRANLDWHVFGYFDGGVLVACSVSGS